MDWMDVYFASILVALVAQATWMAWLGAWYLVPLPAGLAVGYAFAIGRRAYGQELHTWGAWGEPYFVTGDARRWQMRVCVECGNREFRPEP